MLQIPSKKKNVAITDTPYVHCWMVVGCGHWTTVPVQGLPRPTCTTGGLHVKTATELNNHDIEMIV